MMLRLMRLLACILDSPDCHFSKSSRIRGSTYSILGGSGHLGLLCPRFPQLLHLTMPIDSGSAFNTFEIPV